MFVIGRNVEVKVEGEILVIECDLANTIGCGDVSGKTRIIATTIQATNVPHTDLYVDLIVRQKRR